MTETKQPKATQTKRKTTKSKVVTMENGLAYNDLKFSDVYELLNYLQSTMKVRDNRNNSFGGFTYHNLKDIYASLKPLLVTIKGATLLPFTNTVEFIGERYYVKAVATLRYRDSEGNVTEVSSEGLAEQGKPKAKMDESQMTGGATSYAQKYALDNMFMLDDNLTADYWNNGQTEETQTQTQASPQVSSRVQTGIERCFSLGMTDDELENLKTACNGDDDMLLKALLDWYNSHKKAG